jgi:hypothetical protein
MTDEAQYVELLFPMVPHGDVDGALDWVSGVMLLDVLPEHFTNIAEAPPDVRVPVMRAWAHETFHYIQFSSLGFMYDWAAELAGKFRTIIKNSGLLPLDFAKVKRLIHDGPALLEPADRAALEAHYARLDEPSDSGLTARAIIESHAYFVERRTLHPIKIASDWTPHLRQAPAPIYRIAFDALAYVANYQKAFDWFPAVAAIALCCERPASAFDRLAFALARDTATVTEPRAKFEFLQNAVQTKFRTPIEGTDKPHTLFTDAAQRLAAAAQKGFPIFDVFIQPYLHLTELADKYELEPPIIFKPLPKRQLAIKAPEGSNQGSILALFTIGAIAKRLLQNIEAESQSRSDSVIQRISWLVRDHVPVLIDLSPDDLRSGDSSRIAHHFEPSPEKAAWWGRVGLRLPKELDATQEAQLPRSPEARRLLAALHAQLPMFPVYLSPDLGGFFDWFGSIAPEDALGLKGVNVADERVRELAMATAAAINASAHELGLNPWIAVHCLLAPYFDLPDSDHKSNDT